MSAPGGFLRRRLPAGALHRRRGASRLEMLAALVLIGIVAALLLERLTRYQEYAEKAVMEATITNLRSGLRVRVAELMIGGRMAQMGRLLDENPVAWLAAPPPNYGGLLAQPDGGRALPGHWYFDAGRRQLVYLPQHRRFFQPGENGVNEVRLQAMARAPSGGMTRSPAGIVEGVALVLVRGYRWGESI